MIYLACYDVADDGRRRRVENVLRGYGYRVQWSVYLLSVEAGQYAALWHAATGELDEMHDSLRVYRISRADQAAMVWDGAHVKPDFGGNVVLD